MKAHILSRRNRAVGFAIVVSIIMLGAAALASVGVVLAPRSSPGGTSTSLTATSLSTSPNESPNGRAHTAFVDGSNMATVSSSAPAGPSSSSSTGSSSLELLDGGPASFALSSGSGTLPAALTASGTDWVVSGTVTFTISSGTVTQTVTCSTDISGAFTDCPFTIDTAPAGSQTVTATDSALTTGTQPFLVYPSLAFDPSTGVVGSDVVLNGLGFTATEAVTPSFGGSSASCIEGIVEVTSDGSFTCTVAVPASPAGPYAIAASTSDDGPIMAVGSFTVTPSLTFSPSSGDVGSMVTLTGSGFTSADLVTPYFGGSSSSCNEGTVYVLGDGSFSCTVPVPSVTPGPYGIGASTPDDGTITAAETFGVNSQLTAGDVTPASPALDSGQSIPLAAAPSGGTTSYSYQWYSSSTNSGGCDSGTPLGTSPTQSTGALAAGTYYYCYVVTDSDSTSASSTWDMVTVSSAPTITSGLATPVAMDVGQTYTYSVTATGGTGTLSYTWTTTGLTVVSGCSLTDTTCVVSGSAGDYTVTAVIGDQSQGTGDVYPSSSSTLTVNSALGTPTIFPLNPTIDSGQSVSFTSTWSGGTPDYMATLYSGASLTCSSDTTVVQTLSPLVSGSAAFSAVSLESNLDFCIVVTDSSVGSPTVTASSGASTVTVDSALAAPGITVAPTPIDSGQSATLSTTSSFSGGTPPYTCQWMEEAPGGSYSALGGPFGCTSGSKPTASTGTLTMTGTWSFELQVLDSSEDAASLPSNAVTVTVDPALTAPAISVTPPSVDMGQTVTLSTSTSFSGGTPTYTCQWLEKAPGAGSYRDLGGSFSCTAGATPSKPTGILSTIGTWNFELQVMDSSGTPVTIPSNVATVVVNADPTVSVTPVGPLAYDVGQTPSALAAGVTYTGPNTYTVEWYNSSTPTCNAGSFDTETSGTSFTPSTASGGITYYCAVVTDSGVSGYTSSSNAVEVEVGEALAGGTPSPTSPTIDSGQSITLTATATGGSEPYTYQWYSGSTATACVALGSPISGATLETYSASPTSTTYYCYVVTDMDSNSLTSGLAKVAVDPAPAISVEPFSVTIDSGQTVTLSATVTGGTGSFSWQWYDVNGAISGASGTGTTAIYAATAADTGIYVIFTDTGTTAGATPAATATSTPTVRVVVNPAPTISSSLTAIVGIDVGQTYVYAVTATGGTGTLSYAWATSGLTVVSGCTSSSKTCTVSGPAKGYTVKVTIGDQSDGTGGSYPTTLSALTVSPAPMITSPLTAVADIDAGQTYAYSITAMGGSGTLSYTWTTAGLTVVSGCTSASTTCAVSGSVGSSTVSVLIGDQSQGTGDVYPSSSSTLTVHTALRAPATPTVSAKALDVDQVLTVTGVISSTGTPPYQFEWLYSTGSGYSKATMCSIPSGSGVSAGGVSCIIPASALTVGDTYTFELQVTDSAVSPETQLSPVSSTVAVSLALVAGDPTPTSPTIDSGQSIMLTANPSGGSGAHTYQWYSGSTASVCIALGSSITGATLATYSASPTTTTYYCYVVTDSATSPEAQTSSASSVVAVSSALTAPSVPTVSASTLNVNQALTMTVTLPSTGTPPYSWQWLVLIDSDPYSNATQCAVNDGTGASAGATETCSIAANALTAGDTYTFELRVTDSATSPITQTSAATSAVTVTAPSSSSNSLSIWVYVGIGLALFVLVVATLAVLSRRRRRHAGATPPIHVWQEEPAPPAGSGPIAPIPAYLETPEDTGRGLPGGFTVSAGGTAAVATMPPSAEPEPDIDALMAELDRISVDILKVGSTKGTGRRGKTPAEEDDTPS